MKNIPNLPMRIVAGGPLSEMLCGPIAPYSPLIIEFLSALSRELFLMPESRKYPDIAAFAFWCRNTNITRLSREFDGRHLRLGRGLVLHIAPGNVPINFAFTLAFGLLSGNANIVRIAEKSFPQTEIISRKIDHLFQSSAYEKIAAMNRIVQYPRDDFITGELSKRANARVLWGGDQTITHLRKLSISPRCVDISFADRYSIALLDVQAVLDETDIGMVRLAEGFFNDVYLQNQDACSSPHLLIWHGPATKAELAKQKFWAALVKILREKYEIAPIDAVDKFVHLCRTATVLTEANSSIRHENLAYRVQLINLPNHIEDHRGRSGFFYEYTTDSFDFLQSIVNSRYQTLTCFGIDRNVLARQIVNFGLTGIDRIVPIGKALDMGVIWDGYDLIGTLTRVVYAS